MVAYGRITWTKEIWMEQWLTHQIIIRNPKEKSKWTSMTDPAAHI